MGSESGKRIPTVSVPSTATGTPCSASSGEKGRPSATSRSRISKTSGVAATRMTFSTLRPLGPSISPLRSFKTPTRTGRVSRSRRYWASSNSTGGRRAQARRCSSLVLIWMSVRRSVTVLRPKTCSAKSSLMYWSRPSTTLTTTMRNITPITTPRTLKKLFSFWLWIWPKASRIPSQTCMAQTPFRISTRGPLPCPRRWIPPP